MDHLVEFNRKLCLPHRILCWHFPLHLGLFLSGISPYILLTLRFPGWKNELCTHYNGQLLSSLSFYHCKWSDIKKGHFGPFPGRTLCNSVPSLTYRAICTTHQICPIAPLLFSLPFFKKKKMQRHGSAITCAHKIAGYCKIAYICSTWNSALSSNSD